jgi:two-component system, NarL family, sensor histidine kinase LiaS
MKQMKLYNIQWQWVRYAVGIGFIVSLLQMVLLSYILREDLLTIFLIPVAGMPFFVLFLFLVMCAGAIFGFAAGKHIKKRLDELEEATMAFERGNYAYRVPDLGPDEIGTVGRRLNTMSHRIEDQIASLQRLSSERAEWSETLKQATITEERQRLARELHDAVSQQLFAISMMTKAAQHTIEQQPEKAVQQMIKVEEMAGVAQSEMRALLLHLRPAHLEGKGLREGVQDLLEELQQKHDLSIVGDIQTLPSLAKGIEDHLFRIIQESISNVLRHAKATTLQVRLATVQDQVRLKIEDDGVGFNPDEERPSSYGLQSMGERVNEIGGVLDITSLPNKGTVIEVKVPLVKVEGYLGRWISIGILFLLLAASLFGIFSLA